MRRKTNTIVLAASLIAISASALAQSNYGTLYSFGSSSTDTENATSPDPLRPFSRFTNGPSVYVEQLGPRIGARFDPSRAGTNFAYAGATSGVGNTPAGIPNGLTQIDLFRGRFGSFAPDDIGLIWNGLNDWSTAANATPRAQYDTARPTIVAATSTNLIENVRRMIGLGAKNIVFLNLHDLGRNPSTAFAASLVTPGTAQTNAAVLPQLIALQRQSGAEIHYFDTRQLFNQIYTNPSAYGFVITTQACATVPSCLNGSFEAQNAFLHWDGTHYTSRLHELLASGIANQLNAPYAIAPQLDLVEANVRAFAGSLLGRLDTQRLDAPLKPPAGHFSTFAAARSLSNAPVSGPGLGADVAGNSLVTGTYAGGSRDAALGTPGYDYDIAGVTLGLEYVINPALSAGIALNYASTSTDLEADSSKLDLESYQIAAFESLSYPSWFVDLAAGFGFSRFDLARPGIIDNQISGDPLGTGWFGTARTGYLFDAGPVRIGPIAGITYSRVHIQAYSEGGDPLLTQRVESQDLDAFQGSAGIQVRFPFDVGWTTVNSFLNLTVEHDFLDDDRTIVTSQTYATSLPFTTRVGSGGSQTYGRIAAGSAVQFRNGIGLQISAETDVGRSDGDAYAITAGLTFRF